MIPEEIPCCKCGAKPGELCRTKTKQFLHGQTGGGPRAHGARIKYAELIGKTVTGLEIATGNRDD